MKKYILFTLLFLSLSACGPSQETIATQTAKAATLIAAAWTETPTQTFSPTPTLTPTPTQTATPTLTPSPSPTSTLQPTKTKTPTPKATKTLEPIATSPASQWDRYQPRTLKEIILANENTLDITEDFKDENRLYLNFGNDYASTVLVTYIGEFRKISEEKLFFLDAFTLNKFPDLSEEQRTWLFQAEGLFIEDGVEYWLPVQTQLISYMFDELEEGDEVELLLVWGGWLELTDDEVEWVFLVNTY